MSFQKDIEEFVLILEPFAIHIGTFVTLLFSWISFVFLPIWQLYFLPGLFGGIIAGKNLRRGFLVGFLGGLIGEIFFLNFALITSAESVELLIEAALGISGLGIFIHIVILLIWALFSGFGGIIGASLYSFIPYYEILKK